MLILLRACVDNFAAMLKNLRATYVDNFESLKHVDIFGAYSMLTILGDYVDNFESLC